MLLWRSGQYASSLYEDPLSPSVETEFFFRWLLHIEVTPEPMERNLLNDALGRDEITAGSKPGLPNRPLSSDQGGGRDRCPGCAGIAG